MNPHDSNYYQESLNQLVYIHRNILSCLVTYLVCTQTTIISAKTKIIVKTKTIHSNLIFNILKSTGKLHK